MNTNTELTHTHTHSHTYITCDMNNYVITSFSGITYVTLILIKS